jgi:hypothetical protein|tara:strand:+ start:2422 stop:2997 length:576 start_codon:yes stop_codon:yes gene_type:complete
MYAGIASDLAYLYETRYYETGGPMQEVEDFFFEGEGEDRGAPQYQGSTFNAYQSINPSRYTGRDRTDMEGDALYADLIRAQTQDYMTRYAPVENFLASEVTATGTKALAGDLARTRESVLGAAQNVQGMQTRRMEGYGLTNRGVSAQNQTNTVSTLVGAMNSTRAADSDRRTKILTGGLGGITQKAVGQGV